MFAKRSMIVAASFLGFAYTMSVAGEQADETTRQAGAGKTAERLSNAEKVIYSLGYELGRDIKRQDLELSREPLLRGVEDALSGANPLVNARGRQAALNEIKQLRAEENLQDSLAFLAANAEKDGVTTLPSGLQYKELNPGQGETPGISSRVTVNYRGTLIDGTEFDSSYQRGKPSTFALRKVIKGWREGLQLMKEGAKWALYIPPDLAYGKRGPLKRIPPNSALIFEVELVSVDKEPVRPSKPPRPPVPVPAER